MFNWNSVSVLYLTLFSKWLFLRNSLLLMKNPTIYIIHSHTCTNSTKREWRKKNQTEWLKCRVPIVWLCRCKLKYKSKKLTENWRETNRKNAYKFLYERNCVSCVYVNKRGCKVLRFAGKFSAKYHKMYTRRQQNASKLLRGETSNQLRQQQQPPTNNNRSSIKFDKIVPSFLEQVVNERNVSFVYAINFSVIRTTM